MIDEHTLLATCTILDMYRKLPDYALRTAESA
jgi:hypothetical protein